tara:strand:+ start:197 stop:397 length:201 start_codon:yes stop_codon:yes gene_type:complete
MKAVNKYKVDWVKKYFECGTIEVLASSLEEAEDMVYDQIGDYEGSLQYDVDGDEVTVKQLVEEEGE